MTDEKLKYLQNKSSSLPRTPGVYLMKNKAGKIIYVGKSRSLRDRVSSYFHLSTDASAKTVRMVSQVDDFETIFCDTEIEALALENNKIKQYTPKYNILLKDSKSYPYIKVTMNDSYPRIFITRKRLDDGAKYYGPYSGTSVIYNVTDMLERTFKIPTCSRSFPRDIGKERPCLYKQMGKCVAPCDNSISQTDYYRLMENVSGILKGNVKDTLRDLNEQMLSFSDAEKYEEAARTRDTIASLKRLQDKQKVVGSPSDECDILAVYSDELCTVISVFYIRSGIINDFDRFIFGANELTSQTDYDFMSSFMAELYEKREYIPSEILLSFEMSQEERTLTQEYLKLICRHAVSVKTPQKGEHRKLCEMVFKNAHEQAMQYKNRAEQDNKVLLKLSSMLSLDTIPSRIEAYDISNLGKEHITAGMIVVEDGNFKKSDYRVLKMKSQDGEDDYGSMKEAIKRRIAHLTDETGSFAQMPDLILLDGGAGHVHVIRELLKELSVDIPIFGMVKDEHHKTRTLVTENDEISIAKEQSVFVFLYKIQEEVHRFTISKMENAKRKTLKTSVLEEIEGIGPKKAKTVLKSFKTLTQLKEASLPEIQKVSGISKKDAEKIYYYLKKD